MRFSSRLITVISISLLNTAWVSDFAQCQRYRLFRLSVFFHSPYHESARWKKVTCIDCDNLAKGAAVHFVSNYWTARVIKIDRSFLVELPSLIVNVVTFFKKSIGEQISNLINVWTTLHFERFYPFVHFFRFKNPSEKVSLELGYWHPPKVSYLRNHVFIHIGKW